MGDAAGRSGADGGGGAGLLVAYRVQGGEPVGGSPAGSRPGSGGDSGGFRVGLDPVPPSGPLAEENVDNRGGGHPQPPDDRRFPR